MTYIQILEKITKNLLLDLGSLRVMLIIAGFAFNIFLFTHNANNTEMLASIGLLTLIYGWFFKSKSQEHGQTETSVEPEVKQ